MMADAVCRQRWALVSLPSANQIAELSRVYTNRMAQSARSLPRCAADASGSLIYGATWRSRAFTIPLPVTRDFDPSTAEVVIVL